MLKCTKVWVLLSLAFLLGAASWSAVAAEPTSDKRAVALAEGLLEALGGEQNLAATRFLRFEFFGFRLHHVDRHNGQHRLEGKTGDGDEYVVLHNVNSGEGEVWLKGEKLSGDDRAEWLKRAYSAWINDTYWLLMPYKLLDPGVTLKYAGQETLDEVTYDKVELSFDSVGLTPGDRYWAFINPTTGLMDRWAYHLQDWKAEKEPTVWLWGSWQQHGGIQLSSQRIRHRDGAVQTLSKIRVFEQLPDEVFSSPKPVAVE